MQLRQASGPWGPRRCFAFQYVAENGYLPKDWDWAASSPSAHFPPLPYLVSSSMGGICDLITSGVPPLRRAVPDSADVPLVTPSAETLLHVAADLAASADRATARAEIRVPPVTPKPPPPARAPSDTENVQTTDVSSDYQSDGRGNWDYSSWKRSSNHYRRPWGERIPRVFFRRATRLLLGGVGFCFWFYRVPLGIFGLPLGEGRVYFLNKR